MLESEGKELITPATTPGSITDDKCFVTPFIRPLPPKQLWYKKYPLPLAIISISIFQIVFYFLVDDEDKRWFRYEPNKQYQIWRFLTYMLIHENGYHLTLNVVTQYLFAVNLEKNQGRLRVTVLYLGGVVTGALGASCVRSDAVVGASAGGYALLISHIPHVLLNYETTKYKICRCLSVGIITISDITYNVTHSYSKDTPLISWGAHAVGGISGFFLALLLFKCVDEEKASTRTKVLHLVGTTFFSIMLLLLIVVNYQAKKCNPQGSRDNFIYIC